MLEEEEEEEEERVEEAFAFETQYVCEQSRQRRVQPNRYTVRHLWHCQTQARGVRGGGGMIGGSSGLAGRMLRRCSRAGGDSGAEFLFALDVDSVGILSVDV